MFGRNQAPPKAAMNTKHPENNFNFLRLSFALLVLLSHAPEIVDGNRSRELLTRVFYSISFGDLAVDGFFLLSGYLIVQSWEKTPVLWTFLRKRLLRIFPGFIAASLVCAFVVGPLGGADRYFADFSPTAFLNGVALLQPPVLPPTFAGTYYAATNTSMWTIAHEFSCYLLVLAAGSAGLIRRRALWALITALIFSGLLMHKLGYPLPDLGTVLSWKKPFMRLASFFFAGGCFYLYREMIPYDRRAAIVAAVALVVCMFSWRGAEFGLAIFGGYLLFFFAFTPIRALTNFENLPDVSYGVYLYGFPVQKLLLWFMPGMSPWALFPISVIGSLALGALSWYAIERPFMSLKNAMPAKVAMT